MSLNYNLSGMSAPVGSYLCNSLGEGGLCSDIYIPVQGKILHMNDKIDLLGNELWSYCPDRKAFYFHCDNKVLNKDEDVSYDRMLCSRFIWKSNNRNLGIGEFSGGYGDLVYFHDDSFNGSVEAFSNWLRMESGKGFPIQLLFSLEKPFLCTVDFSNHVKYYGFENTSIIYNSFGNKKEIQIG